MRASLFAIIAISGFAQWSPAQGLESRISCDIEDDAVPPDALKELERILKELTASAAGVSSGGGE